MARTYTKSKRAENQSLTRDKIVEAAVSLHGEIGPAATSVSLVAERAGVQRHTVYAHFPDDRALLMACSEMHLGLYPLPDPSRWAEGGSTPENLGVALGALYGWFAEHQQLVAGVLRDAEHYETLREIAGMRFGAAFAAIHGSLANELNPKGQAALWLALSFYTWRTLTRDTGLSHDDAVAMMVRMIESA